MTPKNDERAALEERAQKFIESEHFVLVDIDLADFAESEVLLATNEQRELLAQWMIANSFGTGHGDTLEDLLGELSWQVKELRKES